MTSGVVKPGSRSLRVRSVTLTVRCISSACFPDGNVHSHIDHLKAMVVQARAEGLKRVRIHALLDGRDVPETSALEYVVPFEAFLAEVSADGFDARIASGGGRQNITMDRYDANWPMVEKAGRPMCSAKARSSSMPPKR